MEEPKSEMETFFNDFLRLLSCSKLLDVLLFGPKTVEVENVRQQIKNNDGIILFF